MLAGAHIKDGHLHLRFVLAHPGQAEKGEGPLGHSLMLFIRTPPEMSEKFFDMISRMFFHCIAIGDDMDELWRSVNQIVMTIGERCFYYYLYAQAYMEYLLLCGNQPAQAWERIRHLLAPESPLAKEGMIEGNDLVTLAALGKQYLWEGFRARQKMLLEDLNAIYDERGEWQEFTPIQRLFLLMMDERHYLSGAFTTMIMPDTTNIEGMDLDDVRKVFMREKSEIVEVYSIDSIDNLIELELFHMLKAGIPLKKCRNCGGFFVPMGRSDAEYCDFIAAGETKRCSDIGAVRQYQQRHADDPIYYEFNKAYKRNNNRVRYGRMQQSAFFDWSEEAREKRDACVAGEISLPDFKAWLGNK